jgi:hypothetical protein
VSRVEDLLLLADPLDVFPPAPALDGRIETALRRRRLRRRSLAVAAAAAVCAALVGAVSPAARSAFVSWIEFGGTRIERTDELPAAGYRTGTPDLGERVTLAEARRRVPYPLRMLPPSLVGSPSAVFVRRSPPGDMVTFVYGALDRPRLLLSQWQAGPDFFAKFVPLSTPVEHVLAGDNIGYWVSRAHGIVYLGPDGREHREGLYLSSPALLWSDRSQFFRLEADVSRERALELAASLR